MKARCKCDIFDELVTSYRKLATTAKATQGRCRVRTPVLQPPRAGPRRVLRAPAARGRGQRRQPLQRGAGDRRLGDVARQRASRSRSSSIRRRRCWASRAPRRRASSTSPTPTSTITAETHLRSRAATVTGHGAPHRGPANLGGAKATTAGPGLGPRTGPGACRATARAAPARRVQRGERVGEDGGAVVGDRAGPGAEPSGVEPRRPSDRRRPRRRPRLPAREPGAPPSRSGRAHAAHVDARPVHEEPLDHRHRGRRRRRALAVSGDCLLLPPGNRSAGPRAGWRWRRRRYGHRRSYSSRYTGVPSEVASLIPAPLIHRERTGARAVDDLPLAAGHRPVVATGSCEHTLPRRHRPRPSMRWKPR